MGDMNQFQSVVVTTSDSDEKGLANGPTVADDSTNWNVEDVRKHSHHVFNSTINSALDVEASRDDNIEEGLPVSFPKQLNETKKVVGFTITSDDERRRGHEQPRAAAPRYYRQPRIVPVDAVEVQGREEQVTVSTLSIGQKGTVQVETPREMPRYYMGIVVALILTSTTAFLVAFYLGHASMN